jgi:hypothetical protein
MNPLAIALPPGQPLLDLHGQEMIVLRATAMTRSATGNASVSRKPWKKGE